MIAYEIPQLYCECGMALMREENTKVGGRYLVKCTNPHCRHNGKQFSYRPREHKLEE